METTQSATNPTPFRIFLASPGDVPLERKLARETIAHISSERRFRGRIDVEIIAWDQPGAAVAMEAGLTPQEAIAQGLPKPEDCDLVLIVLWSRIGTQLPGDFDVKEDGTPYLSGTEWEYLNALKGYRNNRKPSVWIYRRQGAPQFAADDPELAAKLEQWQKVETFFKVFTNPDGSLAGGINYYQAPDDFRQQFEHHLRDRMDKLLETLPQAVESQLDKEASSTPNWSGSPYPGLAAFTSEQAPIFFGRGGEIDQLLKQFSDPQVQFVAVVGVSGSGKSSLVNAGLLPRLRTGIVGNSPWTDLALKPGERGGNPFLALAYVLKPLLAIADQTEDEIARAMQTDFKAAQHHLTALLEQRKPASELLLLIDQFEELFTQSKTEDYKDFVKLLESLVASPQLRVIVTLRADFYARAIEEPTLAGLLRRDRGTFPLDPPSLSAIHQMIIRPAEAAGVELEEGLAQRLLNDAGEGPGAMSLIAFTLQQLYEKEKTSGILSISAYEASGGVQGAVQKRAEAALQGLGFNLDSVLPTLFANLVEVNEHEIVTRRRSPQSLLLDNVTTAANALTQARLLVTGKGENDQPVLEVAHEIVLDGWQRLHQWIADHAEALRARRDLERVAAEWENSGRLRSALRGGKLLQRYLGAAEPLSTTASDYLTMCKMRQLARRLNYALLSLLVIAMLSVLIKVSKSDYPPTLAAKALYVELGLWPVPKPKMETIPAGEFEMGDLSDDLSGNQVGQEDERPVHTVHFDKPFEMGKYEVTFDEYDLFAAATGRDKPSDQGWGRGTRPVINISWDDAIAYTQWLAGRTGLNFRLQSEAEWEYAARANTTTLRYWPDRQEGESDLACQYANVFDVKNEPLLSNNYTITWDHFNCEDEFAFTAPVGQFKANAWKLHDMLGNVLEWTQDCYDDTYDDAPDDGSARQSNGDRECGYRVLRGGSWLDEPQSVRSSDRVRSAPEQRSNDIGFRLARTL